MNSNYGRSTQSGSLNSFDFDLGINLNRSKPLNAQNNNTYTQPKPNTTTNYWQPNKPSWTHQLAAPTQSSGLGGSLNGPTSMVGDITGRSWASSAPQRPSGTATTSIGIANKNPNLFSDLLGSNLGTGKGINSNVPLKNVTPVSSQTTGKSAYSMSGVADSLPKSGNTVNNGIGWNSSQGFGSLNNGGYGNKNQNLGGSSMKGSTVKSNNNPFGSLVDFSSKPTSGMKSGNKTTARKTTVDDAFGGFQNAPKTSSKLDDFGSGGMQNQPPVQSSGADDFDIIFSSSSTNTATKTSANQNLGFAEVIISESDVGLTTELEGFQPPPAGVTSSSAKSKGMDNYKTGQYPDAIKWFSWAVILLEKTGDNAGAIEVLSSRASCYKEVGEYKKAVADCSKVLEKDVKNVAVLVQRALLYESMEKYKLGAEDLRTVMNIDPGNRVARSTIHRLTKLAS